MAAALQWSANLSRFRTSVRTPAIRYWRKTFAGEGLVCYYGLPLIAKGRVLGVLEVFHRSPLDPDQEWFDFFKSLAGQAAIAIENSMLFQGIERSNLELAWPTMPRLKAGHAPSICATRRLKGIHSA